MGAITDGEKIKHISYTVNVNVQVWAEQKVGSSGYIIFQKMDFPGAGAFPVHEAKNKEDADILIEAIKKAMARNIVEGSEIDVSSIKK